MEISAKSIEAKPMEIEDHQLKKIFPNLSKEIIDSERSIEIHSIRSDTDVAEKKASTKRNLANYNPDIIDFIRRCDNNLQAAEIIDYMEKRSEITHKYALKLRQQLQKKGVRSFGSKKEEGYYSRADKL